jgi:hypothetical protein
VIKSHVLYRLSYGLERIEKALLMWGSHGLRKPQTTPAPSKAPSLIDKEEGGEARRPRHASITA